MLDRSLALAALSFLIVTAAGCALAPYGPSVGGGPGFVERKLDDGTFMLTFYGEPQSGATFGPNSRKRQLRQNVLRRAEELCGHEEFQLDGFRQARKPQRGKSGTVYVPQIITRVNCSPRTE